LSFAHPPDAAPKWGFQLQAVDSSTGDSAGVFIHPSNLQVIPGLSASVFRFRRYLEHGGDTSSVYHGRLGPVEWAFEWVAPQDSSKIYFFAAGNAANGDEGHFGDHIFSDVESTFVEPTTVGVPGVGTGSTSLELPRPNPFSRRIELSFEIARAGIVDLSIYDLQGRKIRTLHHGYRPAGVAQPSWDGTRDDGEPAKNGVYFVRLSAPGLERPIMRKVTLAH
jgi:hypothetical protein